MHPYRELLEKTREAAYANMLGAQVLGHDCPAMDYLIPLAKSELNLCQHGSVDDSEDGQFSPFYLVHANIVTFTSLLFMQHEVGKMAPMIEEMAAMENAGQPLTWH